LQFRSSSGIHCSNQVNGANTQKVLPVQPRVVTDFLYFFSFFLCRSSFGMTISFPFSRLPVELFLYIRSYLFLELIAFPATFDFIENFHRLDSSRSWRNFLSLRNDENWKAIRKQTMMWSLNSFESLKYMADESFGFRTYLIERMVDPNHQLQLTMRGRTSFTNHPDSFLLLALRIHTVHLLSLDIEIVPSLATLKILTITSCLQLHSLGNFPHLETLRFSNCNTLMKFGEMPQLQRLVIEQEDEIDPELLATFPLEQLISFYGADGFVAVMENMSRLTNLRELHLIVPYTTRSEHHIMGNLPFPELKSLTVECFGSIDLTGLTKLKYLSLIDGGFKTTTIKGKEEIFPQLNSFSFGHANELFLGDMKVSDFVNNDLLFGNLRELAVDFTSISPQIFTVPEKVRCLTIDSSNYNIIPASNKSVRLQMRQIVLVSCVLDDLSLLRNIQSVTLADCQCVSDLSPLKDVPYLKLNSLTAVKDFSSLGKQRYLEIVSCDGLQNNHIRNFGNIFQLRIYACAEITIVENCNHNRYLGFYYCPALLEVVLTGVEYISVVISDCSELLYVDVIGRVYCLDVSGNTVTDLSRINNPQNCVHGPLLFYRD
jgi:hypothetical protein